MILTYCLKEPKEKEPEKLPDEGAEQSNLSAAKGLTVPKANRESSNPSSPCSESQKLLPAVSESEQEIRQPSVGVDNETANQHRRSKSVMGRKKDSKLRAVSVLSICGLSGKNNMSGSSNMLASCAGGDDRLAAAHQTARSQIDIRAKPPSAAKSTQTISTMLHYPDDPTISSEDLVQVEEESQNDPQAENNSNANSRLRGKERMALYRKLELVGEGSYAKVFKGYSLLIKQIVALKEFSLEGDEGVPFTAIREASLLRKLRHANIVTLHDIVLTPRKLLFVFEYVLSDLHRYLQLCPNGICVDNTRVFFLQLLRGLAYCHAQRILHRDLKPQNLLISPDGELKICDFGLARAKSVPVKTLSSEVVTLWYRSPDVLLGSTDYDSSLDMWAAGCILVEMLTGWPLFPGRQTAEDQVDLIFRAFGTPTPTSWPGLFRLPLAASAVSRSVYLAPRTFLEAVPRIKKVAGVDLTAVDLAQSFLRMLPKARLSAAAALCHPFFGTFPSSVFVMPPEQSVFESPHVHLIPDFALKQHRLRASFADSYSHIERQYTSN